MDIWSWVHDADESLRENGFDRLADLLEELPDHVVDGRAAAVEAIVPEALALARAARAPWIEVFVRHWWMQSRVTDQAQGEAALLDAVDALDKAHADDTVHCPQAVCAVQDLCLAYGATDGPAYVEERLAVCDETLARIDPSWPCWMCIIQEKADALIDAGRFGEAHRLVEGQVRSLPADDHPADRLLKARVGAALGLGDPAAAMAAVEAAEARPTPWGGRTSYLDRSLDRARASAASGLHDGALAALPPPDQLTPAQYVVWAQVRATNERAGHHPLTAADRRLLRRWCGELVERGAWHDAQTLAAQLVRSAAAAGSLAVAGRDLDRFDAVVAQRRHPEREKDLQAELSGAVATATPWPVILPAGPDLLPRPPAGPGTGAAEPDLEAEIEMLTSAARRWPDHEDVALRLAAAWAGAGDRDMAKALLVARLRDRPTTDTARLLGHLMVEAGEDALRSVEDDIRRADPAAPDALWARLLYDRGDWKGSAARCEAALAVDPTALGTRRLVVDALVRCGRYDEALAHARLVVDQADPPLDHDRWATIIAASAVGGWSEVRAQSIALGWPVAPGDAPLDEPLERCLVRFPDGSMEAVDRTGPATGVVASIARPGARQRHGWRVLIEPTPTADPIPADPEADDEDEDDLLFLRLDGDDLDDLDDIDGIDGADDIDGSDLEDGEGIDIGPDDLDDLDELAELAGIEDLEALGERGHLDGGAPEPAVGPGPEAPAWITYPLLGVLDEVECRAFDLIGLWIDQAAWLELRARIEDVGAAAWIHSAGFAVIDLPDSDAGEPVEGMWASVAVPAGADVGPLWATIRDAGWPGPLLAPSLAEAAGEPEAAARHRAGVTDFGF